MCPRRRYPTFFLVKVLQPAVCCTPISLGSCSKTQARGEPFFKTGEGVDMELLWLPEGFDLVRAIKLSTHDTCFAVVERGGAFHPRYRTSRCCELPSVGASWVFVWIRLNPFMGYPSRLSSLHDCFECHHQYMVEGAECGGSWLQASCLC